MNSYDTTSGVLLLAVFSAGSLRACFGRVV